MEKLPLIDRCPVLEAVTDYIEKISELENPENRIILASLMGRLGNVYNERGIDGVKALLLDDDAFLPKLLDTSETIVDDILKILGLELNDLLISTIKKRAEVILSFKKSPKIHININEGITQKDRDFWHDLAVWESESTKNNFIVSGSKK